MTGVNWRFTAGMQRMKALVEDGFPGRLLHATATWYGQRYAEADAPLSWRNEREMAGIGVLGDSGVHLIDAIRWLAGELRRVVALSGIAHPHREVAPGKPLDTEDYCEFLGELESGAHVTVTVSRVARATNFHRLHFFGTDGALAYEFQRDEPGWATGRLLAVRGQGPWEAVTLSPPCPGPAPPEFTERVGRATFAPLVRILLDSVQSGAEASPSFEDGLRAQAVAEAVLQSAEEQAWVTVPG
jgi:predicted dehydrogenase